jgi:hypothetical protein
MISSLRVVVILFLFGLSLLTSCSGDQEKAENTKKSAIEQQTDKAAQEAALRIKAPLDQAKMSAEQETNRIGKLEEQVKKEESSR